MRASNRVILDTIRLNPRSLWCRAAPLVGYIPVAQQRGISPERISNCWSLTSLSFVTARNIIPGLLLCTPIPQGMCGLRQIPLATKSQVFSGEAEFVAKSQWFFAKHPCAAPCRRSLRSAQTSEHCNPSQNGREQCVRERAGRSSSGFHTRAYHAESMTIVVMRSICRGNPPWLPNIARVCPVPVQYFFFPRLQPTTITTFPPPLA